MLNLKVFTLKQIKWCELISSDISKMNPVLKMIETSFKAHVPVLFGKCPYKGKFSSLSTNFTSIFSFPR
jgi:hypothetical protein